MRLNGKKSWLLGCFVLLVFTQLAVALVPRFTEIDVARSTSIKEGVGEFYQNAKSIVTDSVRKPVVIVCVRD